MKISHILVSITFLFSIIGCTEDNDAINTLSGGLGLSFKNVGSSSSSTQKLLLSRSSAKVSTDLSDYTHNSITRGKPDEFYLTITKLELLSNDAPEAVIFDEPAGHKILVTDSKIDLSALFGAKKFLCYDEATDTTAECTNEDGTIYIPTLAATYDRLSMTFLTKTQVKGCVSGVWGAFTTTPGTQTYCTRTNHSTYVSQSSQNSDFGSSNPELMDFHINSVTGFSANSLGDEYRQEFTITGGITIAPEETSVLTLLFDTSQLLSFYNQGNPDSTPSPSVPSNASYFYNEGFFSSLYVFVGSVGAIEGYSYLTETCATNIGQGGSFPTNGDFSCPSTPPDPFQRLYGKGWMTLIYDSLDNPIVVGALPTNDQFTIKGSNLLAENFPDLVQNFITTNSDGTLNISFSLPDATDEPGLISNFQRVGVGQIVSTNTYYKAVNDGSYRYGLVQFTREL